MIPTLMARSSKRSRKLLRSLSKKGSLLFHSISIATLFLKQSTLWVGLSNSFWSTTTFVSNPLSLHPRSMKALSICVAIVLFLPPGKTISLFRSRKSVSTSIMSCYSTGKSRSSIAEACFHSRISYRRRMNFGRFSIITCQCSHVPILHGILAFFGAAFNDKQTAKHGVAVPAIVRGVASMIAAQPRRTRSARRGRGCRIIREFSSPSAPWSIIPIYHSDLSTVDLDRVFCSSDEAGIRSRVSRNSPSRGSTHVTLAA